MPSQIRDHGDEPPTAAERAVRRRVAAMEESAQSDVRALMAAGLRLMIAGSGRRGPRVADIVAEAGLSNDSFYRYFAGKDALVEAIVDQGARAVVSFVRHRMSAARTPAEQFRAGISAIMRQVSDADLATKTRAVLSNSTGLSPDSLPLLVTLVDSLTELFTAPVTALGADDPVRAARTVAGAAVAAMQYHLLTEQVPDRRDLEYLSTFLLAGLSAPGPAHRGPDEPGDATVAPS